MTRAEMAPARGDVCSVSPAPKPTWHSVSLIQQHLVILLAQGRGLSAARPLGVEVEGSATESPAQPDPPRNNEDPWKNKRPGCDCLVSPFSMPTLHQCHPEHTVPSLLVFLTSPGYVIYSQGSRGLLTTPTPNTPVIQLQ